MKRWPFDSVGLAVDLFCCYYSYCSQSNQAGVSAQLMTAVVAVAVVVVDGVVEGSEMRKTLLRCGHLVPTSPSS